MNIKNFLDQMRKTWQFLPQHFVSSAIKKQGRDKILTFIDDCNTQVISDANNQQADH